MFDKIIEKITPEILEKGQEVLTDIYIKKTLFDCGLIVVMVAILLGMIWAFFFFLIYFLQKHCS